MPVTVANTELTNTLNFMRQRVNQMAYAMSTTVLTADGGVASGNLQIAGSLESNALYVNTIRGGNTGTANVLYVSSNVVVNSALLLFQTAYSGNSTVNTSVNSSSFRTGNTSAYILANSTGFFVGNSTVNTSISSTGIQIANSSANAVVNSTGFFLNASLFSSTSQINVQTSGTSAQVVDSFATSSARTAEYTVSIKNNNVNEYQTSKLLLNHDNSTAYITEYAVITTGNPIGTFSTDVASGNVRLLFTPIASNTQVKAIRSTIVT